MSLNIENEETCRLVRELASLTSRTATEVITDSVRERLEREKRRRNDPTLVADIRAIGERCAKALRPGPSSAEIGDFLYDEQGLPK